MIPLAFIVNTNFFGTGFEIMEDHDHVIVLACRKE